MRKITALVFKSLVVASLLLGVFGLNKYVNASDVIVEWNFPDDSNDAVADGGAEDNLDKIISVEGAGSPSFNYDGKTTKSARSTNWNGEDNEKYWQIEFTAVGYEDLKISSKQKSSNTGPRDFSLQYKIENEDVWKNVVEDNILLKYDNFISGALNQIPLPEDCNNQELIYVRWIKNSDMSVNGGSVSSGGVSNIDDIIIEGVAISTEEDEDEEDEDIEEECVKNSEDVKINEIFPYPDSGNGEEEFVEIKNFGESCAELSEWKIEDEGGSKYLLTGITIEPGEVMVFVRNFSLNNDSDSAFLFNSLDEVDKVSYDKAIKSNSLSFDGENWAWTLPTPGDENEFKEAEDEDEFEGGEYNIRLNEILPNPKGDEKKGEYVEIYNGENFAINLKDWILKDSSKTKFTFSEDYEIAAGDYLTIFRDTFKFSLNNSGKDSVYLLDPDENIVSSISYESAKENISYNFSGVAWNWSKHLTPGKENKFNSAPKVKIKKIKSGYVGIPVYFEVDVKAKDDDELKYRWEFDDGSRSYLQNVSHTFKKKGTYKVKLIVDDGGSGVEKSFSIKIKKYPQASVEIIRLLPNPDGNDTGEEWVEIKNNSAKEINLKGWKIATGQKNLVNHSISDDIKITARATFQLTRENSLFFLNNKEANIELRYPNGETASKISYKKDKIEEGEICQNIKGACVWISSEQQEIEEEATEEEKTVNILERELLMDSLDEKLVIENIGKYSQVKKDGLLDDISQVNLTKNNSDKDLVVDLNANKDVIYQVDNSYHFTHSIEQTHWAMELVEDVKAKIIMNGN